MEQEKDLKWEIQDQLRKVPMKAPVKALVWDLLSRVDVKTGVIPADHTPSLTELEESTCLGRSTITTYLRALEETGWVPRVRPSAADSLGRGQRTLYRLAVGSFDLPAVIKHEKHKRKPRKDEAASDSSGDDLVQEMTSSGDDLAKHAETGRESSGDDLPRNGASSGDDLEIGQEMTPARSGDDPNKEPLTEVLSSSVHQGSSSTTDAADSKPKKRQPKPEPKRDDVDQLCTRLAEWIVKNGSKPPKVSATWKREARLLLDTDNRELSKALALIDWCQQDGFWRKNILSMPKFRQKYDQLRLAAVDDWNRNRGNAKSDWRDVSGQDHSAWTKRTDTPDNTPEATGTGWNRKGTTQ